MWQIARSALLMTGFTPASRGPKSSPFSPSPVAFASLVAC
ncbi:hypothetical protein SHIRM173S_04041 [Streptomyces hirsutus]